MHGVRRPQSAHARTRCARCLLLCTYPPMVGPAEECMAGTHKMAAAEGGTEAAEEAEPSEERDSKRLRESHEAGPGA